MNLQSLLAAEPRGLRLPFRRRRRGRLEQLRRLAAARMEDVRSAAPEVGQRVAAVRRAAPEVGQQAVAAVRRAAPEVGQAVASVRRAVVEHRPQVDAGEILQERLRLDRVTRAGRRPRGLARLQAAGVPWWVVGAAILGGFAIGLGVGMMLTGRRQRQEPVRPLDAAADEIKAAWPALTDDDIAQARGSVARLVKTIRQRTGQDAGEVRERLESIADR